MQQLEAWELDITLNLIKIIKKLGNKGFQKEIELNSPCYMKINEFWFFSMLNECEILPN
jgi:hypothetical protein